MSSRRMRWLLAVYLLLLMPAAWLAMRYDRYSIDGDAVAYMDIADLLRAHNWHAAVNGYWHPLYPAVLAMAQGVSHTSRGKELSAYYIANFVLFLLQIAAMGALVRGLVRLRQRLQPAGNPLLSAAPLMLVGTSLLVIAMGRELSLGKVRTDGLLQVLLFLAVAALLHALAGEGAAAWIYPVLMGISLGLAYLTKSFAFPFTLLCLCALCVAGFFLCRRKPLRVLAQACIAALVFGAIAGPYALALSRQKGRFTFGDSGNLNYVWYVSGTEKMHLEPWMTGSFGSATVKLVHPEQQLLASPGVYSYKALPHGTYPAWFDPTYWNERITPRFSLRLLLARDTRNVVLIFRYLLNHSEPLILLAVLLMAGSTVRGPTKFAWPAAAIGIAVWLIYAMVNVEERYVTAGYLLILLPAFAALSTAPQRANTSNPRSAATLLVLLFSVLVLGELYRADAQNRRDESVAGDVPAWRDRQMFGVADGLAAMGVHPGDEIACIGPTACLYDHYWARLAGARITTEIYVPETDHLMEHFQAMPNHEQAIQVAQQQGAKVLVGKFDPGVMNAQHPAAANWERLGETSFYALPLNMR